MPTLRRHWFLLSYLGVVGAALLWPGPGSRDGWLHLATLQPWLIAGIFLCAGLTLPGRMLSSALGDWRAHAVVQGIGFVLAPLLGLGLAWLAARLGQPAAVQGGLVMLCCLPTTIGSCVALSGLARGNQGIAVVESVLGNLAGLILTPLLIVMLLDRSGDAAIGAVIAQLAALAAAPVLLGQALRWRLGEWLDQRRAGISVISSCLLLGVLLGLFSDLATMGLAGSAAIVIGLCLVLHAALFTAGWLLSARAPRPDRSAIAITASHKTAALGVPLISLLCVGDPALPQLLLPLALYHVIQLTIGALLAGRLARP